MTELQFDHSGPGWDRPRWRQALLWLRWRPYFWTVGEVLHWRFRIADSLMVRFGRDLPGFRVVTWIGKADEPWEHEHVIAIHEADRACKDCGEATGTRHTLIWEEPFSDYRWIADRWHEKEQRYYTLRPEVIP